jgi:hypothetical protein
VFEELEGSRAITDYLRGEMRTVRASVANDPDVRVRAEIGRMRGNTSEIIFSPSPEITMEIAMKRAEKERPEDHSHARPCAIMRQGNESVKSVVMFEVANGKILRYDMCMSQLYGYVGTGIYPTCNDELFNHREWLLAFRAASKAHEGFRELRRDIYFETMRVVREGGYPVCYKVKGLEMDDKMYDFYMNSKECKYLEDYPEIEVCSETGKRFCEMSFFDGEDTEISVTTVDGQPPKAKIHGWTTHNARH